MMNIRVTRVTGAIITLVVVGLGLVGSGLLLWVLIHFLCKFW